MASFIQWYCKQIGKKKLVKADFEGQAYKIVRPFHKNIIPLQFQMEECYLLLTYKIDLTNSEDLEYLVSGNKERRHALSISKLKAAYYLDFRLEELVPSLWTESESDYDISLAYERLATLYSKLSNETPHYTTGDGNATDLSIQKNSTPFDGTLSKILEKLDYMFKDYELYKYNPGMENRIWNDDDKRRIQPVYKAD
ncbi:hypothetical protein Tco_1195095 [Tanacetum coccineum]